MPPLETLQPAHFSVATRTWLGALRVYIIIATLMVAYKLVRLAL